MPRAPRSGRQPYPGGQFGDPTWVPDPQKKAQAAAATKAGPPPGFPPAAKAAPTQQPKPQPAPGGGPTPVVSKAKPGQPSTSLPRPTLSLPSSPSVSDGGGLMLGLLLYVLGLNYLRHGKAGVTAWFSAKLFNKVTTFPADPVPGTYSRHDVTA